MTEDRFDSLMDASIDAYFGGTREAAFETLADRARRICFSDEEARSFYTLLASSLLGKSASEPAYPEEYPQCCRFLAWFATVLFSTGEDLGATALHEVGTEFLLNDHAGLSRLVFRQEWLARKRMGIDPSELVEVWAKLAVASYETGRRKSAKRLLQHACGVCDGGKAAARPADMAYRLLAACAAVDGDIPTAAECLMKAEPLCQQVYSATPTQVHLAWVRAICLTACVPLTLYRISVAAVERIAENVAPEDCFADMDMVQHILARTSSSHLAVLSLGATIRLIDEGFGGDLSAEDLAVTRNNFGNALLHAGINQGARQAFQNALDVLQRDKNTSKDPRLMYQLAHSFAGIGYTYYNDANAAKQKTGTNAAPGAGHWLARAMNAIKPQHDHVRDALRHADRWLSKALEALRKSHDDQWIDARIWACSARVCSRLGNTTETHRRFARALLAGRKYWRANSQELAGFFNPDFDTRLKYMEAFAAAGGTGAAVILAKAAVHAVHEFSLLGSEFLDDKFSLLDRDRVRGYVLSRSNVHRNLIEKLSSSGRHNEAEQAYDLLKLDIHSEYAQRSLDMIDVEAMVGLTKAEREALQNSGVTPILDAARGVTDEAAVVSMADRLAAAFQKLSPAIEDRLRAYSKTAAQDGERRLRELSERLGMRTALIRYLIAEESAQIVVVCDGQRTVHAVNAKQRDISIWVFELRQRCRHPRMETYDELLRLSNLLYDLLVAPVYSVVHGRADTLYVQLDQPLAGMPFAALQNGSSFLTEEFSIVLLNPAGQAVGPNEPPAGSARKQVSIFLCSDLPGAELPSAAKEGEAVRAGLTAAGGPFKAQVYAHEDCTAETFIAAMGEPGLQSGAIHLATHANFNATSDTLSVLAFHDGAISVHRLRDLLEASPCEVGLFVLSACGTARQDVDVEGFSVTLLRAGVISVLATLWESLDFSAPEFFESFYRHCADLGSPRAVAQGIQAAQRKCRSSHAEVGGIPLWHPAHWAPYAVTTGRI